MSFYDILAEHTQPGSQGRFERLMQGFLRTVPWFEGAFRDVWLWSEFPFRDSLDDRGIDMVARTPCGDFWAIRCRPRTEGGMLGKSVADAFLSASGKVFMRDDGEIVPFAARLWISTSNSWSPAAERIIRRQNPPVLRVNLADLAAAPVDWDALARGVSGPRARLPRKELMPHQAEAAEAVSQHFRSHARSRLVMGCGTGKTLVALRVAERQMQHGRGLVLYLSPTLAAMDQALREWSAESARPLRPVCVCTDMAPAGADGAGDGFSVADLACPSTVSAAEIARHVEELERLHGEGLTAVFSTYRHLPAIAAAQKRLRRRFDLVICDEAHWTAGVSLKGEDAAAWARVHDDSFIRARRRLSMTGTPTIYEAGRGDGADDDILCSVADEAVFGPEVFRFGFAEAVERGILADYKVLVLTVSPSQIPLALLASLSGGDGGLDEADACRLMGCINGLSKRMLTDVGPLKASDPAPMRKAVAHCRTIKDARRMARLFNGAKERYYETLPPSERAGVIDISMRHVDKSMPVTVRDDLLAWQEAAAPGRECRILANVSSLSEGVDVSSLDAAIFLSSRCSQIDVVQAVGRVVRMAPGKRFGYVIVPVLVPDDVAPEDTLGDASLAAVWTALNALRAHDERFGVTINKIALNQYKPGDGGAVLIGDGSGAGCGEEEDDWLAPQAGPFQLPPDAQILHSSLYALMVQKVGARRYWEEWAEEVAVITGRLRNRIERLIGVSGPHKTAFESFLSGLRRHLSPDLSHADLVELLAQHMVTVPIFGTLFDGCSFVDSPVTRAIQHVVDLLEARVPETDSLTLARFYGSVRRRLFGVDNPDGRQIIVARLYRRFFRTAFPAAAARMGVIYTPAEIVDFVNQSAADFLWKEFDHTLSDEGIHVLDPFAGSGGFLARMISGGLIDAEALPRKFASELHGAERELLAYYIAQVNIENAMHVALGGEDRTPFDGLCLTDTFQLAAADGPVDVDAPVLPHNSRRLKALLGTPIQVIVGNAPCVMGRKSAGERPEWRYPGLEARIAETYGDASARTDESALDDPCIRAFRWASDRLDAERGGVIILITVADWLENPAMDGFRWCLEREFDEIRVLELHGGRRSGSRRREGDNVFGPTFRSPTAVTALIRKPGNRRARALILHAGIGDGLGAEAKLGVLAGWQSMLSPDIEWSIVHPDERGSWSRREKKGPQRD